MARAVYLVRHGQTDSSARLAYSGRADVKLTALGHEQARHAGQRLAEARIAGGSVYDALVGAVAVEHDLPLATRDRRALDTYGLLGVEVELIG